MHLRTYPALIRLQAASPGEYEVRVFTSDLKGAGTDGDVFIQLKGKLLVWPLDGRLHTPWFHAGLKSRALCARIPTAAVPRCQCAADPIMPIQRSRMALHHGITTPVYIHKYVYVYAGEHGNIGETILETSANNFERAQEDVFKISGSDIGALTEITVRLVSCHTYALSRHATLAACLKLPSHPQ